MHSIYCWLSQRDLNSLSSCKNPLLSRDVERLFRVNAQLIILIARYSWLCVTHALLPAGCREAANCRYCFYSQAKNQVFAPQGRLVTPIPVKLCKTDGHLGPLGHAKFHINRRMEVGMRPQKYQKFHFLVKSRPVGATPLIDFQNF